MWKQMSDDPHLCVPVEQDKCVATGRVSHWAQLWPGCWVVHPPIYLSGGVLQRQEQFTPTEQKTTTMSKELLQYSMAVVQYLEMSSVFFLCSANGLFCM